jgi:hypothetical protein
MWLDFQRRPVTADDLIRLPLTTVGAHSLRDAVAERCLDGAARETETEPTTSHGAGMGTFKFRNNAQFAAH